MGELRRDPVVGRWVIVRTEDPKGPADFDIEKLTWKGGTCPFCAGNEKLTPPEIEAIREDGSLPNTPGWEVRVVPNKFPALIIYGDLARRGVGIYDVSDGVGAHEIIIESPKHRASLADLAPQEIQKVILAYKSRSLDLRKDKRFKFILIFKNYGKSAGASLEHSHSQLIALPMVPKNVQEELKGTKFYYGYHERCIFCDILKQELQEKERVVAENEKFLGFCPFVSRFPYEMWIIPKAHFADFTLIPQDDISYLANILKELLLRMKILLSNSPYNFIIHTSPFDKSQSKYYHWHIEIMPKLMRTAGFEWGTGFYIVSTPPEVAAKYYRRVKIK